MADVTQKKINLAEKAVIASTQFVDALNVLLELKNERAFLLFDFQDSDFVGTNLAHLSAGIIGSLLDFVVPSLQVNFQDDANGNRNKQTLLQMRK